LVNEGLECHSEFKNAFEYATDRVNSVPHKNTLDKKIEKYLKDFSKPDSVQNQVVESLQNYLSKSLQNFIKDKINADEILSKIIELFKSNEVNAIIFNSIKVSIINFLKNMHYDFVGRKRKPILKDLRKMLFDEALPAIAENKKDKILEMVNRIDEICSEQLKDQNIQEIGDIYRST